MRPHQVGNGNEGVLFSRCKEWPVFLQCIGFRFAVVAFGHVHIIRDLLQEFCWVGGEFCGLRKSRSRKQENKYAGNSGTKENKMKNFLQMKPVFFFVK